MTVAHAGELYKWVDKDGHTHVSDKPPHDAEAQKIKLKSYPDVADVPSDAPAAVNVVMLSTAWCGVCKSARQYMNSKGIPFTEYDVEKTTIGRSEYQRLNGKGVPIILVGKQRMDGFGAERLEQMLRDAAKEKEKVNTLTVSFPPARER